MWIRRWIICTLGALKKYFHKGRAHVSLLNGKFGSSFYITLHYITLHYKS